MYAESCLLVLDGKYRNATAPIVWPYIENFDLLKFLDF